MKKFLYIVILFLLSSCMTYHITTESLVEQIKNSEQQNSKNQMNEKLKGIYRNNLLSLKCYDKFEAEQTIPVNDGTQIRIKFKNNKRKIFYLNTLQVRDSLILGSKTHFFNAPIKPIKIKDIIYIEMQK
ncbi:MAG: hypothetical protein KA792_04675 [Bacteroidales bacterium]|nr:hypothetical protein [Bacteroidales bacterium]